MIKDNISEIRKKIAAAGQENNHNEPVTLVVVTKNQTIEKANEAIDCGIFDIGENRVQALVERNSLLKPAKRHLIGHLQTNKVKQAVLYADLIQSVDSIKLLNEIEKHSKSLNKKTEVLIQINIANEAAKFGISPSMLPEMLKYAEEMNNIIIRGLMAIMPIETKLKFYQEMYDIFLDNKQKIVHNIYMDFLSMGMSSDFETAVKCGANMVRIGSYVFHE
jgi:pyridoxal phosphate enzyme (YggS family)